MLQGEGVGKEMVESVVFDVERFVDQIDTRWEYAQLFIQDPRLAKEIRDVVAKAHLQAALLHARGIDLESSIVHYEKAVELLGHSPADWSEDLELFAYPGLMTDASEIVFRMARQREVVDSLRRFWSAGVVTRFEIQDFSVEQRAGLQIVRVEGASDAFSEAFFAIGEKRFAARATEGLEEFRVVLPPGRYKAASNDPAVPNLEFVLNQGGIPDPIVLSPNTFSFALATPVGDPCVPKMTLNGVVQNSLENLPFGTYRVESPPTCQRRLPDKITVEQRDEVTLRTEPERLDLVREGQPIFLFVTTPAGSTYNLRF